MITYQEAYDRLTTAYLQNKVNPYNGCACFVGNLLNGSDNWIGMRTCVGKLREKAISCVNEESGGKYTTGDILSLEAKFMSRVVLPYSSKCDMGYYSGHKTMEEIWQNPTPEMEEILWRAFVDTLEDLKKLHISKGEVIDKPVILIKRQIKQAELV